jgi:cytoskeletal protein RodZ
MKIGEILRTERESRGLSLLDVEEQTKIRAKYLQALEEENYDEIPGEAYCMGFLRNYARFLEIDPEPLIYQYRCQAKKADQSPTPIVSEQPPVRSSTGRIWAFLGLAVFVILVFSISFVYFNNKERTVHPPKPPVSQEQDNNKQQTTPAPVEENITMQLVGNQKCWTRVTVDGNLEFEGILNSGETKDFEAKDSIHLRLGNAGGVDVIYNGEKQPPLGASGQVAEKEYTKSG